MTVMRINERAVTLQIRDFVLKFEGGPAGRRGKRNLLIGTHPSADVVHHEPMGSRLHARFDVEELDYVLQDVAHTEGDLDAAAAIAQIHRKSLESLIRRLKLRGN